MTAFPTVVTRWHELITSNDPSGLECLIADDAVFHSPAAASTQRRVLRLRRPIGMSSFDDKVVLVAGFRARKWALHRHSRR